MTTIQDLFARWAEALPILLDGLLLSLQLTAISLGVGVPIGVLLAVQVRSKNKIIRTLALVFVEGGRGMPLLILLYLMYYGLPQTGINMTSFLAAVLGATWAVAAYSSEYIRAGIEAVPRGQHEAAAALGLSRRDSFKSIILPQGARISLPAMVGEMILAFQATSVTFAIALPELMSRAYFHSAQTFQYMSTLTLAGIIYAAICMPLIALIRRIERKGDYTISTDQ